MRTERFVAAAVGSHEYRTLYSAHSMVIHNVCSFVQQEMCNSTVNGMFINITIVHSVFVGCMSFWMRFKWFFSSLSLPVFLTFSLYFRLADRTVFVDEQTASECILPKQEIKSNFMFRRLLSESLELNVCNVWQTYEIHRTKLIVVAIPYSVHPRNWFFDGSASLTEYLTMFAICKALFSQSLSIRVPLVIIKWFLNEASLHLWECNEHCIDAASCRDNCCCVLDIDG